jgi:hypothetical protein
MIPRFVALALILASLQGAASAWSRDAQPRLLEGALPPAMLDAPAAGESMPRLQPSGEGQPRPFGIFAAEGAMSLKQVLACLRRDYPGQVLDAQLFDRNGQPFYRLKLLGSDGKVQALVVDARTCAVVEQQ